MTTRRLLGFGAVALALVALAFILIRKPEPAPLKPAMTVAEALGGPPAEGFARATGPRRFVFPLDHGPHAGFRTEWWYFTGNLATAGGRRFGYQLTFFRVTLVPRLVPRSSEWGAGEVFMAHFAVTDVAGKKFHQAERFSRAALDLAGAGGTPLAISLENWSAVETAASPWSMRLSAADSDVAIDLDTRSITGPVLNGEQGLSRKGSTPGNASYYYSLPRLATAGTIRVGTEIFTVTGLSWLDREWSTSALEPGQVGWDWFALQLEDGRNLMFYNLRRRDGTADPFSSGTLVGADGSVHRLGTDQVLIETTTWWQSPASGTRYPAGWRIRVPHERLELEIVPRVAGQEWLGSVRYWEGAVAVRGTDGSPGGAGYVELTGYARGGAPGKR